MENLIIGPAWVLCETNMGFREGKKEAHPNFIVPLSGPKGSDQLANHRPCLPETDG